MTSLAERAQQHESFIIETLLAIASECNSASVSAIKVLLEIGWTKTYALPASEEEPMSDEDVDKAYQQLMEIVRESRAPA